MKKLFLALAICAAVLPSCEQSKAKSFDTIEPDNVYFDVIATDKGTGDTTQGQVVQVKLK